MKVSDKTISYYLTNSNLYKLASFCIGFIPTSIIIGNYGMADDYAVLQESFKTASIESLANGRPLDILIAPINLCLVNGIDRMWILHLISAILSGILSLSLYTVFIEIGFGEWSSLAFTSACVALSPGILITMGWSVMIPLLFGYITGVIAVKKLLEGKKEVIPGILLLITILLYQPAFSFALMLYALCFLISDRPKLPSRKIIWKSLIFSGTAFLTSELFVIFANKINHSNSRVFVGSFGSHLSFFWNADLNTALNIFNPLNTDIRWGIVPLALTGITLYIRTRKSFNRSICSIISALIASFFLCFLTLEYASNRQLAAPQSLFAILIIYPLVVLFEQSSYKKSTRMILVVLNVILLLHSCNILYKYFYKTNTKELQIIKNVLTKSECLRVKYVKQSAYYPPLVTGPTNIEFGGISTIAPWGATGITEAVCSSKGVFQKVVLYQLPFSSKHLLNYSTYMNK